MHNRYVRTDFGRYSVPDNTRCDSMRQNTYRKSSALTSPSGKKREHIGSSFFTGDTVKSIFPEWLELGDILLLLLLFFLYIESEDEEFLIMLAVVGYGIFTKH